MDVLDQIEAAEDTAEAIHALETAHTYDYVGTDGEVARYRNPSNGVTVTYDPGTGEFDVERDRLPWRFLRGLGERLVPERVQARVGGSGGDEGGLTRTYRFAADGDTEDALRRVLERSDFHDMHLGPDRYWQDADEVRFEDDGILVRTAGSYRDIPGGYLLDDAELVELEVGDGDTWLTADADAVAALDRSR